jgi:uncharacterized protein
MVKKNCGNRLSFDMAKRIVDYFLEHRDLFPEPSAGWDFIGGEPLLEAELIDQIIKYIKMKSYLLGHPWFEESQFSMSSNGSLFGTPETQELLRKYGKRLEIGMTIDGPEHVHDMERVYADGRGTHGSVVKNVPLWLKQFADPARSSTKVTISHNNLPYLAESVLYLFSIGMVTVNANVVFENPWEPGDDLLLEQQLDELADAMLAQGLWKTNSCSFFRDSIGKPLSKENDGNWCGSGNAMVAVDAAGNFYPCVRFLGFSLANKPPIMMGNIKDGFDTEVRERFSNITRSVISPPECMECEVATGCAWCPGFNYDDDPQSTDGIGKRAVHICKMHKARVRANDRYQKRLKELQETEGTCAPVCKDGKCGSEKTGTVVGRVTKEESDQIKHLFLRREALGDLFSLLPELEDAPSDLYERVLEDTGRTVQEYEAWWAEMSLKYKWKKGGNWQVNFDSHTVSTKK